MIRRRKGRFNTVPSRYGLLLDWRNERFIPKHLSPKYSYRYPGISNGRWKGIYFQKRAISGWSKWSRWDCPVTCGGGVAQRRRACIRRGSCEGPRTETKKCAENPCPKGAPQQLIDAAKKQIRSDTESHQLVKGEDLTLNCQGKIKTLIQYDFRKAKAIWHHNQETFHPEKERTSVQDSLNLHIWRTLSKDNGVWACEVMLDPRTSLYTAVYTIAVENDIPDIEVKSGDSFSMPCNNVALTMFFHNTLVTEWYHNTSLYEKYEDSKPTEVPELTIKTSSPDDSGIWLCKVVEFSKKKKKIREWATNVVRVSVSEFGGGDNENSNLVLGIIVLVLTSIVVIGIGVYYYLRKKRKGKTSDVERGKIREKEITKSKTKIAKAKKKEASKKKSPKGKDKKKSPKSTEPLKKKEPPKRPGPPKKKEPPKRQKPAPKKSPKSEKAGASKKPAAKRPPPPKKR
ncbi:ig-like domain-containing protein [Caerostris darwini]|uniref:Ig-like domain-containing protein n=1 Tax=Caerostris darwini TaxID=1538125 RepID=A0AAV4X8Q2_9ARAC|nr:ig-like domain-containing protein [Caerostris darwini]